MKIIKLTASKISTVKGTVIVNKKNTSKYFNIRHGSASDGLHFYSIYMDSRYFKPVDNEATIDLPDDKYILKPVFKDKAHIKDSKGNYSYCLSIDDVEDHKKDFIVLWEIPNKFYKGVEYTIDGDVEKIGEGSSGRVRNGTVYSSPAPVLEVFGIATLTWSGTKTKDGIKYSQTITFKDSKFQIGQIIKAENNESNIKS